MESYATEAEYEDLAQRLAAKRERPALAETLVAGVYRSLATWHEKKKAGRDAFQFVSEIRMHIIGGTRLEPTAASLVLIKYAPRSADEKAPWDEWWDEVRQVSSGHDIDRLANEYDTFGSMWAGAHMDSVPINVGYLSD